MRKTRIDRYKVKKAMQGKFGTFGELAAAASISTTTMTKATNSHGWQSSTLDAIANAIGCSPLDILTIDNDAAIPAPPADDHQGAMKAIETMTLIEKLKPTAATVDARQKQRDALTPPQATDDEKARFEAVRQKRLADALAEIAKRSSAQWAPASAEE